MSDIEITALCADAMEIAVFEREDFSGRLEIRHVNGTNTIYEPLHDDAQALALVKQVVLDIHCRADMNGWYVGRARLHEGLTTNADLNRAICYAVAGIQAERTK